MEKVAVIIVNYNGFKYLPDLLGSIFKYPPSLVEQKIIIVDNASTDGSLSWLKSHYPQTIVLQAQKNLGFASGNNLAITYVLKNGFDYVMLLNQDTIVTEGYLDKLIKALKVNNKAAAVQPLLLLHPETNLVNSYGNVIHYLGFGYTAGHRENKFAIKSLKNPINYCAGAACLIKISALKKVGLFKDELFMYHEDLDLGWRFKLAGYQNIIEPGAVVYHKYEFSRSLKKYYFMERNRFMVMLENYRAVTLLLILPALIIMEIGLLLFAVKGGWFKEKIKVYAYFCSVKHWRLIFNRRKQTQKLRVWPDSAIVKSFAGIITNQEIKNFAVDNLANPFFNAYWEIIKYLIIW